MNSYVHAHEFELQQRLAQLLLAKAPHYHCQQKLVPAYYITTTIVVSLLLLSAQAIETLSRMQ
jgi:hypothetical protein